MLYVKVIFNQELCKYLKRNVWKNMGGKKKMFLFFFFFPNSS